MFASLDVPIINSWSALNSKVVCDRAPHNNDRSRTRVFCVRMNTSPKSRRNSLLGDIQNAEELRDIGNLASWTVSSAKEGFSMNQLRNGHGETFWQSDGAQPHFVNIHFVKRVSVKIISIHMDFARDESYTPSKVSIRSGTGHHDLQEVVLLELDEPSGWVNVDLSESRDEYVVSEKHILMKVKC